MKHLNLYAFLFIVTCLASCVNRVEIPEEADKQLFVELEIVRGTYDLEAKVMTSNNLQGLYPIENPEDVDLCIKIDIPGLDDAYCFIYDEERELYYYNDFPELYTRPNYRLILEGKILSDEAISVKSSSINPKFSNIDENSVEIVEEEIVTTELGDFWEPTIRFNLLDLYDGNAQYCQILFSDRVTEKEIVNNEPVYNFIGGDVPFELINIVSGGEAMKQFTHKEGVFIDLDNLESEFFEVKLRSSIPFKSGDQFNDLIFTNTIALPKAHYDYHLGLHNINSSKKSIFNEPALYRSNIEGGLGVFSTCSPAKQQITLKR